MNLQRFKGLRNEEGGSPGGGSIPPNGAPPPSNPPPPAQGSNQPDIAAIVKSVVTETFGELKNGLFADLRKSGALGKGKDDKDPGGSGAPAAGANPPAATQQQNPSPTALSAEDVNRMMERRDALHSAIPSHIPVGARQRMLKDFARDNPDDPVVWAKGYLSDFGLDKPNGSPANPPPQQNQPPNQNSAASNAPPPPAPPPAPNTSIVTDRPVDVLQWDRDMMAKHIVAKGGNPRDFSDPRNAKIWEEIATMTRSAAAQLRLLMESRK